MKILFLPGSHNSPPARFRIWQFVEPLKQLGYEIHVRVARPERNLASSLRSAFAASFHSRVASVYRIASTLNMLRDVHDFDIIMMNRDLVPDARIYFLEPWLARRNPRLIFDFDDAIHLGAREKKLRHILPHFAVVTAGNDYLAQFAREISDNVHVWPTVVDADRFRPLPKKESAVIRLGWSGSRSTRQKHLPLLEPILTKLACHENFEFVVIADKPPELKWKGVKIRYLPWSPDTEVKTLNEFDVGLMPLSDSPHDLGKCGLKAISYMAVGIPAVVSPIGANRKIVRHGETGFHCSTDQEWVQTLRELLNSGRLRRELGANARSHVMRNYSVGSLLPRMIDIFESISGGHLMQKYSVDERI